MTRSDRRSALAVLLALALCVTVAVALFVVTASAEAATYTNVCPNAPGAPEPESINDDAIETRNQRIADVAICVALAERIETMVARLEALDDAAPGTAAQRVALAPKDRERLDFLALAAWGTVGLLLVLVVAQKWYGAWRFLRE